jgi:peptide/nickel transport system substrate-binding protein
MRRLRARRAARLFGLATAVALALATAACGGGDKGGPDRASITIALSEAIDTWDPQHALLLTSFQVFPQVLEPLLRVSPDGAGLEPGLASSYDHDPAARTITFTLDERARFSDGAPVTSADVAFSLGVWKAGPLYGRYFESVSAVETPDDRTVVFRLTAPDPTLLGILGTTNAAVFPADFGGKTAQEFWKRPVGAGAFVIKSETVGEEIVLERNPNFYREGEPRLDRITYKVVSDGNQRLLQFQSGEVDIVDRVPGDEAVGYPKDSLRSIRASTVSVLIMNTKAAPLDDVDLRRAISLAIDRAALVEGAYGGYATPPEGLLPPVIPGDSPCACNWNARDTATAAERIDRSGYDGRARELIVPSTGGPELLAAQAIVPMLEEAGVMAKVTPLELGTLVERLQKGSFELAALNYSALAPSPLDPLGFLGATGYLFSQADVAATTEALAAVRSSGSAEEVARATASFEQAAYEAAAVVPLATLDCLWAVSSRVRGFRPPAFIAYYAAGLSVGQ